MAEDKDDTVYCDIQMPVEQGRELLQLVKTLRDSGSHPVLERVFIDMERSPTPSTSSEIRPVEDFGSTASSA